MRARSELESSSRTIEAAHRENFSHETGMTHALEREVALATVFYSPSNNVDWTAMGFVVAAEMCRVQSFSSDPMNSEMGTALNAPLRAETSAFKNYAQCKCTRCTNAELNSCMRALL